MARRGDEVGEGLRRTWLASERTYLAWLRTGFAALAVSLGVGKVVPALTGGAQWSYAVLGVAFALLGVGLVGYGALRQTLVVRTIRRGEYVGLDGRVVVGLAAAMIVLGIALAVVVVFR
jgi:inner membrane protein YidH